MTKDNRYIVWFENFTSADVEKVGGKNASLGEMIRSLKKEEVKVPDGFAATAKAYWEFLEANELSSRIGKQLESWQNEETTLDRAGKSLRRLFRQAEFPEAIAGRIKEAYVDIEWAKDGVYRQRYHQDSSHGPRRIRKPGGRESQEGNCRSYAGI